MRIRISPPSRKQALEEEKSHTFRYVETPDAPADNSTPLVDPVKGKTKLVIMPPSRRQQLELLQSMSRACPVETEENIVTTTILHSPIHCPSCAGLRLREKVVKGALYTCSNCGFNFNEALTVPSCPRCGMNDKIRRKGRMHEESGRVLLRCTRKGCRGVTFPLHQELKHNRYSLTVYACAIYMALNSISFDKIVNYLKQFYKVDVDSATIHNWLKDWTRVLAPYLLRQKLDCSGNIYLDEMQRQVEHEASGQHYWEQVWQWNSWDPGKKTRLAVKLSRTRDATMARQIILSTLERVRIPNDGIVFWCDKLSSYTAAYQQLVREKIIDPGIIRMISIPKTQIYSAINAIEGVNNKWRSLVNGKLRVSLANGNSLENAELRLLGEIIMQDFIEPRKEFNNKTAAQNANADVSFGPNKTEALVKIAHLLKLEKCKQFEVPPIRQKRALGTTSCTSPTPNLTQTSNGNVTKFNGQSNSENVTTNQ
ncbi:MAG TPA: hypothetical protein VJZ32_03905 [Candidatus Bathyarchaeia archaeon]|nr:hypothetical protein [Candidatus Bathyarchaeia archaeon]